MWNHHKLAANVWSQWRYIVFNQSEATHKFHFQLAFKNFNNWFYEHKHTAGELSHHKDLRHETSVAFPVLLKNDHVVLSVIAVWLQLKCDLPLHATCCEVHLPLLASFHVYVCAQSAHFHNCWQVNILVSMLQNQLSFHIICKSETWTWQRSCWGD